MPNLSHTTPRASTPLLVCHPERSEGLALSLPKGPAFRAGGARPRAPGFRIARVVHAALLLAAMTILLGAGDPDARFKDLGHHMMCTCGCGQVLLECNHVGCQSSDRMRTELAAAVGMTNDGGASGVNPDGGPGNATDDAIYKWFAQKYGQTVIAAPATTGFSRVAWIMPFAALFAGIAGLVALVRVWKNRPAPALADGIQIPTGPELDRFRAQARKETDL